ncbi:hypothetical protein SAMN05216198_3567 [Halopseudomonas litoralis]|uniref:Uncharacterized protein n=1 Tax=Halopseudomonas litoralis TaxID=797277 RepID=A0A1H1XBZ5_9GAMM|nr:hypothetical protein SAMN05216198_3567 [Halopseudomonas litoralis]
MTRSSAEITYFVIGISIFTWAFLALVMWFYIAHTKMDVMVRHLPNCQAIQLRVSYFSKGPIGRFLLLAEIIGVVRTPTWYLKQGIADPDDIRNFPPKLKRLLVLQYNLILIPGVGIFILWGVGKYMGWLR